jgi:hypothetical protein
MGLASEGLQTAGAIMAEATVVHVEDSYLM